MKSIYHDFKTYHYHNENIYERTHHKRVEFWFKNNFLQAIDVESIEIKEASNMDQKIYNPYSSIKQKKWSVQSGSCKVITLDNPQNSKTIQIIQENIAALQKIFNYTDVVLRNCNTNNILNLNMISSIYSSKYGANKLVFTMTYLALKV